MTASAPTGKLLRAQVIWADNSMWWNVSKPAAEHRETGLSEDELIKRFLKAAESKKTRADRNIILILDGSASVTTRGTLVQFAGRHQKELEAIGFGEIWWSDANNPMRLYPKR